MRKILLVAGLLLGGAMLTGTPAKAELGCLCGKLGAQAACMATVLDCNFKMGGVCLSPCDYSPAKMMKHHHHHKKMKKKT